MKTQSREHVNEAITDGGDGVNVKSRNKETINK